jgi:hypothetical protein
LGIAESFEHFVLFLFITICASKDMKPFPDGSVLPIEKAVFLQQAVMRGYAAEKPPQPKEKL